MSKRYIFLIQEEKVGTYYPSSSTFHNLGYEGEKFAPLTPDFLEEWKKRVGFGGGDQVDLAFLMDKADFEIKLPEDLQKAMVDQTRWTDSLIKDFCRDCVKDSCEIIENGSIIAGRGNEDRIFYLSRFHCPDSAKKKTNSVSLNGKTAPPSAVDKGSHVEPDKSENTGENCRLHLTKEMIKIIEGTR